MRYSNVLMFLLLSICCKSEPALKTPEILWQDYITAYPEYASSPMPDADFFHNNEADANRLGKLILEGKKTAASSLYWLYQEYKVDVPRPGDMQIVTDFEGNALAIIATVQVDTVPFHKVSPEYAATDMGTTEQPLEKWKKAHWAFFESFLAESGEQPTEDMLIVCERFKKVWPE